MIRDVRLNKIKKLLNEKDVSMANADQVKEITGFTIGGVSPVGHLNKIDIFIDESLERLKMYLQPQVILIVFSKLILIIFVKLQMDLIKDISE